MSESSLPVTGAGRYAPSPTSDLHLGNLRTALIAWAMARREGLRFVMRIEDLDQQRVKAAAGVAARQLEDLHSLGIDWDGEVVTQSERLNLYDNAISRLKTYECFCTRREIADASTAPHGDYRPYPGTCSMLSGRRRSQLREARPAACRVRAQGASFTIEDRFAGTVTGEVDDFVLQRNDGTHAYNLAVVVDDLDQGITQIVRGEDLLDSAPRQAWLASQLAAEFSPLGRYEPVEYVHVGLAVNPLAKRLAKRDGAVTLAELLEQGHTVDSVTAMIAESLDLPAITQASELLDLDQNVWEQASFTKRWVVDPASTALPE